MAQPTADQIAAQYQADFNRPPTDDEMRSELDNANRYGWDTGPNGGLKAQIDKRAVNTPGGAEVVPGPSGISPAQLSAGAAPRAPLMPMAPVMPGGFAYPTGPAARPASQPANLNGISLQQLMQMVSQLAAPTTARQTGY